MMAKFFYALALLLVLPMLSGTDTTGQVSGTLDTLSHGWTTSAKLVTQEHSPKTKSDNHKISLNDVSFPTNAGLRFQTACGGICRKTIRTINTFTTWTGSHLKTSAVTARRFCTRVAEHTNHIVRYLKAAQQYNQMRRNQSIRQTIEYSSFGPTSIATSLDAIVSNRGDIAEIAALAGLRVEEVPAVALQIGEAIRKADEISSFAVGSPYSGYKGLLAYLWGWTVDWLWFYVVAIQRVLTMVVVLIGSWRGTSYWNILGVVVMIWSFQIESGFRALRERFVEPALLFVMKIFN